MDVKRPATQIESSPSMLKMLNGPGWVSVAWLWTEPPINSPPATKAELLKAESRGSCRWIVQFVPTTSGLVGAGEDDSVGEECG